MIAGDVFDRFGDAERAELTAAVRPASASHVSQDDAFASGVWSCLVEPGDATGGILRLLLGPASALSVLDQPDDEVRRRMHAAGLDDPSRYDLAAARSRWAPRRTEVRIRTSFRCARVLGIRLVVPGDSEWPAGLDDLGVHAPAALWVRGDPAHLAVGPAVALVGCRAATAYGEQVAAELADGLATRGVAIHSGGAYGIDGMAHRAALAADGVTVAIMAGGVDRFYPAGHHDLISRIAASGAVASEAPCGTPPSRWRFLQRNRILAATTAATVVVEAGARSGALNTASHARSLERPIGAVPGPITSPSSAGCHRLVRESEAVCITGVEDVAQLMAPRLELGDWPVSGSSPSPTETRILDALDRRRPRTEARLAEASGLAESVVRATLAVLELEGVVTERQEGWVRAASSEK